MLRLLTWTLTLCCATMLASSANAELVISGEDVDQQVLDNARTHVRLADEGCDAPAWRVRRMFARIDEQIDPALRAFGYYSPNVSKRLTWGEDCWLAEVTIDVGEPVRVGKLRVEAVGDITQESGYEALRRNLPLAEGDILRHDLYESIKSDLGSLALELGYFDAELTTSQLRVDPQARTADVHIEFASGNRYRLGELRLSEQPLDPALIRRLIGVAPGEYYAASTLKQIDRRLSDAGYFRQVEVRPRRDEAQDQVIPIEIQLTPLPRHAWRFGIGYTTDIGPRLSVGYANRRVNRSGHLFDSKLSLSPALSSLTATYTVPGRDPLSERFEFSAALQHEDTDTSESDSLQVGARQLLTREKWTERRFVEILHERSDISDETTESTFVMPGIGWNRIFADDLFRTRRGYRLDLEIRGAHEALLSSTSFFRVHTRANGIYRIANFGRLRGRVESAYTFLDEFAQLPATLRFFAGGDNSVRGYEYKSLGPKDSDNEVIGGENLLTASIEYEHPLGSEDWWAAGFVDAGNAFDDLSLDLEVGYGVGLRWYSPIGRIRVDFAIPEDTSDDQWRIHFGIGADL